MATTVLDLNNATVGMPETDTAAPVNQQEKTFLGFSEKDLVDQINRKWKEADERLQTYFQVGLECWDQYRNHQDFSDKEDWQSRVTFAKAHSAVKQGVANIRKLFLIARDVVQVESDLNAPFAPIVQEAVKKAWDAAGFLDVNSEAFEAGLIMGLIAIRGDWVYKDVFSTQVGQDETGQLSIQSVTTKEGGLSLKAIDPWALRWGPETTHKKIDWIIEEQFASLASLRERGFTIPDEMVNQDFRPNEIISRIQRRTDEKETKEHFEKRAKLREYSGDLIDEKTQTIKVKNAHVIIGNDQLVILAEQNPYWRQKPPYTLGSPLRVAFRFPGQGILEVNRALKANIDAIAQMGTDYLKFSTLPMFEADLSQLENPEDIATGAEPGKMFRKRPGTGPQEAIRQIQIHPLSGDVFNMLIGMDKEYQRSTFISEIVQGLLDTKGETTATEVQSTLAQSTIMLASIARDMEDQIVEPLADMTWDYLFQFMDATSNPSWTSVMGQRGQMLDAMPREHRLALISGTYQFRARGISLQVERQAELQKLVNWMSVIAQFAPQAVPLLNLPEIFKRIHESFSFPNPDLLLAPNAAQVYPQLQQSLLAQQNPAEQTAQQIAPELIKGLIAQSVAANKPKSESSKEK